MPNEVITKRGPNGRFVKGGGYSFWKGKKLSPETVKKLSVSHLGYKHSEEAKALRRAYRHTDEAKKKIGIASLGNKNMLGKKLSVESKNKISEALAGEKCYKWKGDDVGYVGLHAWVRKHLGKPTKCEHCGQDGLTGMKIHWANKSHMYLRNVKDWLRLCVRCHSEYDHKIICH